MRNLRKTSPEDTSNYIRLANHLWSDFPCTGITLRARKALRVIWNILLGAKHLSRCFAPGRAAPNQQIAWRDHFSRKFINFRGAIAVAFLKNWSTKQNVLDLSYAPSNAPWSEIIYFWCTMQNEFMDHEKSSKNLSRRHPKLYPLRIPYVIKFPQQRYYS